MPRNLKSPVAVLINDYRIALESGTYKRPLSPYTIAGYEKALKELNVLMGSPVVGDFSLTEVARVITAKRKTSASNARLMAAVAKTFSKWLWKTGVTKTHVLDTLGVPTFNGRRKAFTDAEFRAILKALTQLPNRTRKRDRALVLLAIGSGLRSNEIRTLKFTDLHIGKPLSESWALIRWDITKSQQERRVRVDQDAAAAIYDYIASDRSEVEFVPDPDEHGDQPRLIPAPLFLTEGGKAYTYDGWGKMFAHIADRLEDQGIKGFVAHRCRHQWATLAARDHTTNAELAQEGGWARGSKVPSRYIDEIPFSEIQRKASPMTAFLRRSA